MKLQKFHALVNIILGGVLALSPFVLFPVCDMLKADGSHMACWYSGIFIASMGVVIVILLFMKWRFIAGVLASGAAVACWLVPHEIIGLCADLSHDCQAVTMPAVGVLITLIVIVNVIELIMNFVRGGK